MYKVVPVRPGNKRAKSFLLFPSRIYPLKQLTTQPATERQLIAGTHRLSKYFHFQAYLVKKGKQIVARFALTEYAHDRKLYLGFYECIDNPRAAKTLFDFVKKYAKEHKYQRIVGPLDASFWLKYRMKIDNFDDYYFGEPYNQPYYYDQWRANGFTVFEEYVSNFYPKIPLIPPRQDSKKYSDRHKSFRQKGYKIRSITPATFDRDIRRIYRMISKLYADFPLYSQISRADFCAEFAYLKAIGNPDFMKIAFYDGKPAGFFICVPDYGNLHADDMTTRDKLSFIKTKCHAKRYIMYYAGVLPQHHGLNKAMLSQIIKKIYLHRATSIGALTKAERITAHYSESYIKKTTKYVLLEHKV